MKIKYIVFSLVLVIYSCKKDEPSLAPVIEFVSLTPNKVVELNNELLLSFKYFDEDGDLGENTSGVNNLFIGDSRTGVVSTYRIKQLAPTDANIAIEGVLTVTINPLVISNGSSAEEGGFFLYVTDRAGNESNIIFSTAFTIVK